MAPVTHITRGSGYISCKLSTGEASRSYSKCVVSYTNPETGEAITGTANADKKTDKNKQVLTFNTVGVRTQEQAERVARAQLNLANKFEMKLDFTMVGNPALMAGASISVGGFGAFDGTYVISKAVHTVSESAGYTTSITLRV